MQKLAKREEQIMQACWHLGKAFIKEIIAELPAPRPHYNSVATMVRILEEKGFLGHETFGKARQRVVAHRFRNGFIAREIAEISQRRVAAVEHAQLHRFEGGHVGHECRASLIPGGTAAAKAILDHPLGKGLGDNGPNIGEAKGIAQALPIVICRCRKDRKSVV